MPSLHGHSQLWESFICKSANELVRAKVAQEIHGNPKMNEPGVVSSLGIAKFKNIVTRDQVTSKMLPVVLEGAKADFAEDTKVAK